MRNIFFFLAASLSSTVLCFLFNSADRHSVKNDYNQVRYHVFRKRLLAYEMMWLEDVNKYITLENRKDIQVLILFSEKKEKGCTMCFKWESEWWQKFIKDCNLDSLVEVSIILYDCINLEQTIRSLNACDVELPINADTSSYALEKLGLEWTPAILIIYQNKIVYHYLSDMNNRDFSRVNMKKFIEFIHLVNKKIVNINKK
jgi:hypothetical protein